MKIIVVGCGRMGAGLARTLDRANHDVTVIDHNAETFESLGASFRGLTVKGVGFDRATLVKAGIERSDGLAACTSSDDTNAVTARIAHEVFQVPTVIARLYDPDKADVYRRLGIQTIGSISWGIKRALDIFSYSKLDVIETLGGNGGIEILHVAASPLLMGHKLSELNIAGDIQVIAVERLGSALIAEDDLAIEEGDQLYVAAHVTAIGQLRDLLGMERVS
ncbi:MAG: TrkA family potassium uptake protein [Actinomycetia bacterium]|nr:TrkA family potassium uptake protein [Actinomycetes bacterium]